MASKSDDTQKDQSTSESDSLSSDSEKTSDSDSLSSDSEKTSDSDGTPSGEGTYGSSPTRSEEEPCRYYNSGHCREGKKCPYLHICKYALRGTCRNGSTCLLRHPMAKGRCRSAERSLDRDNEEDLLHFESDSDGERNKAIGDDYKREPCRYYNTSQCREGKKCPYLHICKYALRGTCHNGSKCNLKHPRGRRSSSRGHPRRARSKSLDNKLEDGQLYQWQLNSGKGWQDIANDYVIEAQYSLPYTKAINLYNTPYGAVTIDFHKMTVRGKNLRVRRLEEHQTEWIWHLRCSRGWLIYGEKDSKGNAGPVQSSEIEKKYQSNKAGSFPFNIGSDVFTIKFKEMRQVSSKKKREVARRPKYQAKEASEVAHVAKSATSQSSSTATVQSPRWQFKGMGGKWHSFQKNAKCSVSNSDIESTYQQNSSGSLSFTANGQPYKLDFAAMMQTNQSTKGTRRIRRV